MARMISVLIRIAALALIFSPAVPETYSYKNAVSEIQGSRPQIMFGHYSYSEIDPYEEELQKMMQEPGGPTEVFALFNIGQTFEENIIVQIVNGKGELKATGRYGEQKYKTRSLSSHETAGFKDIISRLAADKLPENLGPIFNVRQYEYLHLAMDKGIRVCFAAPNSLEESPKPYRKLRDAFQRLLNVAPLKTHFRLEVSIPGTKRIDIDANIEILSFWKKGRDIRIKVKHNKFDRVVGESLADAFAGPFQWIDFHDFKPNGKSPTPPEFDFQTRQINVRRSSGMNARLWALTFNSNTYRVGYANKQTGLWKIPVKGYPSLIAEGNISNPVITPDEQWAVFARADKGWTNPNNLVRIHLPSRREQIIDLPEAHSMFPLAYVEPHRKILLIREETLNPEHYLLDPESGSSSRVHGDFAPFRGIQKMPWQSTGNNNEYWIGITDEGDKSTTIGRYSMKDFKFIPVRKLPEMFINNHDESCFWVDEPENAIYLVYWGDLLSVPLY
jgi:hypothetical protein